MCHDQENFGCPNFLKTSVKRTVDNIWERSSLSPTELKGYQRSKNSHSRSRSQGQIHEHQKLKITRGEKSHIPGEYLRRHVEGYQKSEVKDLTFKVMHKVKFKVTRSQKWL